ncbi:hypothetical protein PPSIR1_30711 [Plesiocystis pacifica SIR-1]|uniref:Uncharacterized protein n=1 Tax=Plesiocystis pacifica SIR-1 TaxID=391625 RepID=A6GAF5_9BACT|nr:hypothetical protein [Plesiocystis pacifica]EDM77143.1 hypothetical protein PPSIR1_30711 [Plesiocystis pacifica SIR-1]
MRRARALLRHPRVEFLVGCGLLLGPLVYALTLPGPGLSVPSVVVPEVAAPAAAEVAVEVEAEEPGEDDAGHIGMCVDPSAPQIVVEQVEVQVEVDPSTHALEFAPLIDDRLVFSTKLADEDVEAWAPGELYAGEGTVDFIAAKAVELEALPLEHYVQAGRAVDLYGVEGKLCSARAGALELVAQYQGEELNSFDEGIYDWETGEYLLDEGERLALIWDHEPAWLSAVVEYGEDCTDEDVRRALWARSPALPAPAIATERATPPALRLTRQHERRFLASETFEAAAADYAAYRAELEAEGYGDYEPTWDELLEQDGPSTRVWSDAKGRPVLTAFEFGYAGESCGDGFDSYHSVVERVRGAELVDVGMSAQIVAVFDSDLDGNWELFYDDADEWGPSWTVYEELPSAGPDEGPGWLVVSEGSVDADWFCPC